MFIDINHYDRERVSIFAKTLINKQRVSLYTLTIIYRKCLSFIVSYTSSVYSAVIKYCPFLLLCLTSCYLVQIPQGETPRLNQFIGDIRFGDLFHISFVNLGSLSYDQLSLIVSYTSINTQTLVIDYIVFTIQK